NFEGLDPTTLDDSFRLEDKMFHAPDAAGSGVIRWLDGQLFVSELGSGVNDESIQLAIDGATAGDLIHIEAGTYVENVTVNKYVHLLGAGSGAGGTVIDGSGAPVVKVAASGDSVAERLTIE